MFRKLLISLSMLLMLPTFASAWSVNSKTSPLTGQGTITPAGSQAYAAGQNSTEYTVAPAAGFRLSRVTLDGVAINANESGKYVAPYVTSKTWRYMVAYFAANTVTITTSVTGSGAIREDSHESLTNIPAGSNRQLLVLPNPGHSISALTAPGATTIINNGDGSRTVNYNNLQANQSVSATFSPVPAVEVDAGNSVTVNGTGAEFASTLHGSATSNLGAVTYTWTGPGLSFGTAGAATTTVFAVIPGTYTATLTAASGGVVKSDFATVTVISRAAYLEGLCSSCHAAKNPEIVSGYDESTHKTLLTVVVTCQTCHDPGNAGHFSVARPVDVCAACHTGQYAPTRHTTTTVACTTCHDPHSGTATGCTACHGCPPATASHQKHFGGTEAQAGYGDTRAAKDFSGNAGSYIFSCGNCHPLDFAKHNNGMVEVELYNPQAATGSLKALNPSSAGYVAGPEVFPGSSSGFFYSKGTCSNVYCHSYNDWTTTQNIPDGDPDWSSKLVVTRVYRDIMWGGAALTCTGCHANPPSTAYPANDGGAGNSHSWIDMYGYENLHNYNHGFEPVSCSYCHNDTVRQLNTFTRDQHDVSTLSEVPISNFSKHVSGVNDLAFDRLNPFIYRTYGQDTTLSLADANYDPGTKTCTTVSCHQGQTTVKWGTPFRWYFDECDRCHGYSY